MTRKSQFIIIVLGREGVILRLGGYRLYVSIKKSNIKTVQQPTTANEDLALMRPTSCSVNTQHAKKRNSSIELLRIIAMLMIVSHHYVYHNGEFLNNLPPFSGKEYFFLLIESMGSIGVMLFFAISAWYLCQEKKPSLWKNMRRAWLLEREVLFYSITLFLIFFIYKRDLFSSRLILSSLFPTATALWWYVTAYVVFLFLEPSLTVGLRQIGKKMHGCLVLSFMILWAFLSGLSPIPLFGANIGSFAYFVFIYTTIAFYRWYMEDLGTRFAVVILIIGVCLITSSILVLQICGTLLQSPSLRAGSTYLTSSIIKLPVLLIGFGSIIIAEKKYFCNRIINLIASTTFGIYLIHEYPIIRHYLWNSQYGISEVYNKPLAILVAMGFVLSVFISCIFLDIVRQGLFKITVEKNKGMYFNKLSLHISKYKFISRLRDYLSEESTSDTPKINGDVLMDQADQPIPPTCPPRHI